MRMAAERKWLCWAAVSYVCLFCISCVYVCVCVATDGMMPPEPGLSPDFYNQFHTQNGDFNSW